MTLSSIPSPATALLARVSCELGMPWTDARPDARSPHPVPLPSRLATADLAWASVRAVCLAAGLHVLPDPDRIAASYRSDRHLIISGSRPDVWSHYSGFWRSSDGWLRTHGNYAHHASRLLAGLRLAPGAGADQIASAIGRQTTAEAVDLITAVDGLAVAVNRESEVTDAELRDGPLLDLEPINATGSVHAHAAYARMPESGRPLSGIRVLDLTRVIAGPVCTRTLALLGADVLRVDPPHLAEPAWQHLDTGHGKRSTLLDARSARFRELLEDADVVVLGYRPAALDRLGLSASALAEDHPGIVIAQLSAWGESEPQRAGFDSLVQAESGIAMIESPDGDRPGALPAQALDHSAGYLLAASVIALLQRRRHEPGTWRVRTSLRRVAAELLGMPRGAEPEAARDLDESTHTTTLQVDGQSVTTVRPAIPGLEFAAPHRWGSDQPRW